MPIRAGRFEHARAFPGQAQPTNDSEWIERLFLLGRIEIRLGMPGQTAERFEAILAWWPDSHSVGPWMQARSRLPGSTHLGLTLSAGYRSHDERHDRDGWHYAVDARFSRALDSRTSINMEPTFEVVEAMADHHGSRLLGFGATISRAFAGGLSVSLTTGAHVRRHAAEDPLFGVRQLDKGLQLGVRVLHRSLRYGGFAPWVGYSLELNRSSIPIHDYRNHGVTAGVSRRFRRSRGTKISPRSATFRTGGR